MFVVPDVPDIVPDVPNFQPVSSNNNNTYNNSSTNLVDSTIFTNASYTPSTPPSLSVQNNFSSQQTHSQRQYQQSQQKSVLHPIPPPNVLSYKLANDDLGLDLPTVPTSTKKNNNNNNGGFA